MNEHLNVAPQYVFQQEAPDSIAVSFAIDKSLPTRSLDIVLTKTSIRAGIKGKSPIIEGSLLHTIKDSLWQKEGRIVTLHLDLNAPVFWPILIKGPRLQDNMSSLDPHSTFLLGIANEKGIMPGGMQTAYSMYKLAAEAEHSYALFTMGKIHETGSKIQEDFCIESDPTKAFEYYLAAAERNKHMFDACFQVGSCYQHGKGIQKNLDEALYWFIQCSHTNEYNADTSFNLGLIYLEKENYVFAKKYFDEARAMDSTGELAAKVPSKMRQWEEQKSKARVSKTVVLSSSEKEASSSSKTTWDGWTLAGIGLLVAIPIAFGLHYKLSNKL